MERKNEAAENHQFHKITSLTLTRRDLKVYTSQLQIDLRPGRWPHMKLIQEIQASNKKLNHKKSTKKQIGTINDGTNQKRRLIRIRKQSIMCYKLKRNNGHQKIKNHNIRKTTKSQRDRKGERNSETRNYLQRAPPRIYDRQKKERWEDEIPTRALYINRKARAGWSTKLPFWCTAGESINFQ